MTNLSNCERCRAQLTTNLKILFACDHAEVRSISGTNANEAVFSRFVSPGDVVMVNSTPAGIQIGVQEMTRYGMGVVEMEHIAELIKECIIDRKPVKEEVNRFRSDYQRVKYSYDEPLPRQLKVLEGSRLDK